MIFSSVEFLLYFLPVFFVLYGLTPKAYRNLTLLLGSLVFYAFGEQKYLLFLMGSVLVNYLAGHYLGKRVKGRISKKQKFKVQRKKTYVLTAAVIGNVGALVLFKSGWGLPLGVSFYTFQILSYLIDVYRGTVRQEPSFQRFADYIIMFPQLIEGPIVRYGEVEGKLRKRDFSPEDIQDGLKVFTLGLAAKVLLADRLGILWHEVHVTGYENISTPLAWLGAFAYSMKLYFDFYGYSLMATGLGRMLGFELPENFHMPYMACSVREFYRRWHVTLGRWFRDYVYIPLGGNRKGRWRTVVNLLIVWALTALWHGFSPNFWIWGGLLWLFIIGEKLLGDAECLHWVKRLKVLPHIYLWLVIPVTWVCFAVTDGKELWVYLGRMFGWYRGINVRAGDYIPALERYGGLFLLAFAACTPLVEKLYKRIKKKWWGMLLLAGIFWLCVGRVMRDGGNPFMYFDF
ncbi:MAG: MBOAT family protein [Roseburia sp.]|nr:MBOAT family protein [Roseburia sp.]